MFYQRIPLEGAGNDVTLTTYVSDVKEPVRDAILVIPGGGYGKVCADREGEPIALAFVARGMNAFVLEYTTTPKDPYQPLVDASAAMSYIRENAKLFSVNPDRVFAVGFSAGGHLCATLGTMWHDKILASKLSFLEGSNRPTGMVLCYPVIDDHPGSFENLFGENFGNEELANLFSASNRVDRFSSPAFIIHTATDEIVPVANSLRMADALTKAGVLCEMHIYPTGPHGMALANSDTNLGRECLVDSAYARWVDDVMTWMKRI